MKSMTRSASVIALGAALMIGGSFAEAQSDAAQAKIRAAIVQSTAAPEKSIEVSLKTGVLTILLVNSNIIGSSHQGYIDDAQAAILATVLALKDDPDYADMNSIRVNYIKRSEAPQHDKIMDSVEFRRSVSGTYVLHTS